MLGPLMGFKKNVLFIYLKEPEGEEGREEERDFLFVLGKGSKTQLGQVKARNLELHMGLLWECRDSSTWTICC